ncbi:MAG: TonB-dependent receptor plug domain-containing protein, partial [Lentilitoribacter sp.]
MPTKITLIAMQVCGLLFISNSAFGQATPQDASVNQEPELEVLTVEGRALSLYQGNGAVFATRTNSDIDKIPQTVQIITQELIEDQAAYEISDLFRSMSGVSYLNYGIVK